VTYSGFGLGAFGDVLFFWNGAATDPNDWVATVSWARATPGVSFECKHVCDATGSDCEDRAETESQAGWRGAFRASEGGHIGSPGYLENPAVRILAFSVHPETGVTLCARVSEGRTFRLRRAPSLEASSWTLLLTQVATNNVATWSDQPPAGSTWFYRLEQLP